MQFWKKFNDQKYDLLGTINLISSEYNNLNKRIKCSVHLDGLIERLLDRTYLLDINTYMEDFAKSIIEKESGYNSDDFLQYAEKLLEQNSQNDPVIQKFLSYVLLFSN